MNKLTVAIVLSVLALIGSFYKGYNYGHSVVTLEWNKERQRTIEKLEELRKANEIKAQEYTDSLRDNELLIGKLTDEYNQIIASIALDYASRLRDSEERYNSYRRDSEGSESERRRLVEHTIRLDRTISEGIKLVEELQGTLKLREQQVKILYSQLLKEIQLRKKQ